MKTKHTVKDLLAFEPCADAREFIAEHKTLSEMWAICPRADWMLWALSKFNTLNESKARAFAVACAEHTLHFYEEKYPDDKRPRLAIEAARRCITDHSPESEAARSAAERGAWSAESDAWRAESAAESAAMSAAWSAAMSAAMSAAGSAAMSAAMSAAGSAAWSAAWSAESAAMSAAWSAESAAMSAAWSAERAARSAAWSAESAAMSAAERAARAARSAAERGAMSARSAAERAENKWQANKLREIFNPFECLCP